MGGQPPQEVSATQIVEAAVLSQQLLHRSPVRLLRDGEGDVGLGLFRAGPHLVLEGLWRALLRPLEPRSLVASRG